MKESGQHSEMDPVNENENTNNSALKALSKSLDQNPNKVNCSLVASFHRLHMRPLTLGCSTSQLHVTSQLR